MEQWGTEQHGHQGTLEDDDAQEKLQTVRELRDPEEGLQFVAKNFGTRGIQEGEARGGGGHGEANCRGAQPCSTGLQVQGRNSTGIRRRVCSSLQRTLVQEAFRRERREEVEDMWRPTAEARSWAVQVLRCRGGP